MITHLQRLLPEIGKSGQDQGLQKFLPRAD
jgi:hypothetical protein